MERIKTFTEWCPNCRQEHDYQFKGKNIIYRCPHCNYAIISCSLCDMDKVDCTKCKASKQADKINNII